LKKTSTPPKFLENLFSVFPLLHLSLIIIVFLFTAVQFHILWLLALVFIIYLFPVLLWYCLFLKINEGKQRIGKRAKEGSSWLICHYLQYNFILFPAFEKALLVVPGLYSLWLRLWGSKIGKGVIWAPVMSLHDRSLVIIDDHSFVGGHTKIASHFLIRQNEGLYSYIKQVKIGKRVIIGAKTSLGPGSKIIDDSFLPAHSRALMGRIERGTFGKTTRS